MKNVFYFLIAICLFSYNSLIYGQSDKFIPDYSVILPSEQGKKMMQQCSRSVPDNIEEFFNPIEQDIRLLESNLKKILSLKSTNCCFRGIKIKALKNYGFQYIGVVINNKKFIYINTCN